MEQKWVRKILQVDGMTCASCEMRIERALKKLDGVEDVKANFNSSNVYITYDVNSVGLDRIIEEIEKQDYQVKTNRPAEQKTAENQAQKESGDKMTVNQLMGIGIIILAIYMVIQHTVGFNFIPEVDASMGYGILFVVGLLTSLHCIAMCGGINLSQCISYNGGKEETGKFGKLAPSLLYNSGRVVSYTVIGGIVGILGSVISFFGMAKGAVAILSGVFMMIMGLNMLNIFPWLRKLNPRMPRIFGNKIHNNNGQYGPFYVGLLNGLMPCGPLQAMQIYALGTGSFTAGALSMFMFSLGTVPLMFGFGAISSMLSKKFTHQMLKASAVLVMVLGFVMVGRGLSLSGINVALASSGAAGNVAKIEGNVQVVTTQLESGRYSPIVVQKGIPVRWTIQANKNNLNGCNERMNVLEYNIRDKQLKPGDNVIEFTPDKEGTFGYSCWMGMIRSNIKVVADINSVSQGDVQNSKGPALTGGDASGAIPTEEIQVAKIANGVQSVTIDVKDDSYSPSVIVLQKGIETKWTVNVPQLNVHNGTMIFPEYNSGINLKKGQNELQLVPDSDFSFQCGTGLLNGYVKVVDDINKVDLEAIKAEVKSYVPPSVGSFGGSGGGGGMSCH